MVSMKEGDIGKYNVYKEKLWCKKLSGLKLE